MMKYSQSLTQSMMWLDTPGTTMRFFSLAEQMARGSEYEARARRLDDVLASEHVIH